MKCLEIHANLKPVAPVCFERVHWAEPLPTPAQTIPACPRGFKNRAVHRDQSNIVSDYNDHDVDSDEGRRQKILKSKNLSINIIQIHAVLLVDIYS